VSDNAPISSVSKLWLRVVNHILPGPLGVLVSAHHQPHLVRAEGSQLIETKDAIEAVLEGLHLPTDARLEAEVQREINILLHILQADVLVAAQLAQIGRRKPEAARRGKVLHGESEVFQTRHRAAGADRQRQVGHLVRARLRAQGVVLQDAVLARGQVLQLLQEESSHLVHSLQVLVAQNSGKPENRRNLGN